MYFSQVFVQNLSQIFDPSNLRSQTFINLCHRFLTPVFHRFSGHCFITDFWTVCLFDHRGLQSSIFLCHRFLTPCFSQVSKLVSNLIRFCSYRPSVQTTPTDLLLLYFAFAPSKPTNAPPTHATQRTLSPSTAREPTLYFRLTLTHSKCPPPAPQNKITASLRVQPVEPGESRMQRCGVIVTSGGGQPVVKASRATS